MPKFFMTLLCSITLTLSLGYCLTEDDTDDGRSSSSFTNNFPRVFSDSRDLHDIPLDDEGERASTLPSDLSSDFEESSVKNEEIHGDEAEDKTITVSQKTPSPEQKPRGQSGILYYLFLCGCLRKTK